MDNMQKIIEDIRLSKPYVPLTVRTRKLALTYDVQKGTQQQSEVTS
jgi:hypothetical protein